MGGPAGGSPIIYKVQRRLALQHRTGVKRRPRQSRRPSAAKRIIRAEVPKDTGPRSVVIGLFPTRQHDGDARALRSGHGRTDAG